MSAYFYIFRKFIFFKGDVWKSYRFDENDENHDKIEVQGFREEKKLMRYKLFSEKK